ncbi:MAG: DNA replication/repair protein RecF, partial [Eubacterium sp.]
MNLTKLHLVNYRNYADETFFFSEGINVICGQNAQGKTNLLESITLLSRGYSHRSGSLSDIQGFDTEGFFAECEILRDGISNTLSVKMQDKKKILSLNHKKETKRESVLKVLNTILFEPDDLKIVKEGPEKRRRFMNNEITGFRPHYEYVLKNYMKILNQRNALLKEIRYNGSLRETLDSWDEQLVKQGVSLMGYRIDYLRRLNVKARALQWELSSHKEEMVLFYQNNVLENIREFKDMEGIFKEKLKASREEDILRGKTMFGPHVDDILIHLNGKDAKKYGSQGQQRSVAISLKLSQIEIYKESTGDYPVVLLDDILSELDDKRQRNILSILGKTQAFITCTDSTFIESTGGNKNTVILIENG